MLWFKKKNKQPIISWQKNEAPPAPPVDGEAVSVIWSEDKKKFCEVFFENDAYKYSGVQLSYDEDFTGYYWEPIYTRTASFFDTQDKAEQAAKDLLQGK